MEDQSPLQLISVEKELETLEQKLSQFAHNIETILVQGLGLGNANILKGKPEYAVFFWNKEDSNKIVKISFFMDGTVKVSLKWRNRCQEKICHLAKSIQELLALKENIKRHLDIE